MLSSLSANPQDRFAGCGSFARALEGIETEKPGPITDSSDARSQTCSSSGATKTSGGDITSKKSFCSGKRSRSHHGRLAMVSIHLRGWRRWPRGCGVMLFVCAVLTNIVLLRVLYKAWASLPASSCQNDSRQRGGAHVCSVLQSVLGLERLCRFRQRFQSLCKTS